MDCLAKEQCHITNENKLINKLKYAKNDDVCVYHLFFAKIDYFGWLGGIAVWNCNVDVTTRF